MNIQQRIIEFEQWEGREPIRSVLVLAEEVDKIRFIVDELQDAEGLKMPNDLVGWMGETDATLASLKEQVARLCKDVSEIMVNKK